MSSPAMSGTEWTQAPITVKLPQSSLVARIDGTKSRCVDITVADAHAKPICHVLKWVGIAVISIICGVLSTYLAWPTIIWISWSITGVAGCVLGTAAVHASCTARSESALIVQGVGVQLARRTIGGCSSRRFIPIESIHEVVMAEGYRLCTVQFFIGLRVKQARGLVPLFEGLLPRLPLLQYVWQCSRFLLFDDRPPPPLTPATLAARVDTMPADGWQSPEQWAAQSKSWVNS